MSFGVNKILDRNKEEALSSSGWCVIFRNVLGGFCNLWCHQSSVQNHLGCESSYVNNAKTFLCQWKSSTNVVCRKLQIYIQDVTNIFLGWRYIIDPLDFSQFYIFFDCLVEHCSFLPLLSVQPRLVNKLHHYVFRFSMLFETRNNTNTFSTLIYTKVIVSPTANSIILQNA